MAVTVKQLSKNVPGDSYETSCTVAGDANYPTGGYKITPAMLGFNQSIRRITAGDALNFASAAVVPVFIPTYNGPVITSVQFQLQNFGTGAELAAATNVSAYSYVLTAEGV